VTAKQKAEAVVNGFTRDTTLERPREWFGWLLPPVTLTLKPAVVEAIMEVAETYSGTNPKIIGLSKWECCQLPRVVVHTFRTPRRPIFIAKPEKVLSICSICGGVVAKEA
jgi:hypothetical protein